MIKVRAFKNNSCVCCKKVDEELLKVGAFNMCYDCFRVEFNRIAIGHSSYNDKAFLDKYYEILETKYMVD